MGPHLPEAPPLPRARTLPLENRCRACQQNPALTCWEQVQCRSPKQSFEIGVTKPELGNEDSNHWRPKATANGSRCQQIMNYAETLTFAKEQFILSLHVRCVCSGPGGILDSRLISVSLGPYEIRCLDSIDRDRAAWSLELISTQHLVISLDAALENGFQKQRLKEPSDNKDYFSFVRCLRNAFSHNPYFPRWELNDDEYKRSHKIEESWEMDLSDRHGKAVEPNQYRHASGLIRLTDRGIKLLESV
jgi:hypothetical protein